MQGRCRNSDQAAATGRRRGRGGAALSRDEDALLDILERIELIEKHRPRDAEELRENAVLHGATLYWLLIIGEAATRVSAELKAQHPEVSWRTMINFRNLIVHGYEHVDTAEVFRVVEADLAPLAARLQPILLELQSP